MKLVCNNLGGERGGRTLFSNLSFTLVRGEALIVSGKNGAGKSTLLRILAGLLPTAHGTIALAQKPKEHHDIGAQYEQMHYLGHLNALKPALSIYENLKFWQNFCGSPLMEIEAALKAVNLPDIGHLPAAYLSAGQKRRVSIAKLLVSHKPVWIVDEPTAALDKASQANFSKLLNNHLTEGGIAVAATHNPLGIKNAELLNMDKLPIVEQRYDEVLI